MMLVQKQQPHFAKSSAYGHRRTLSAATSNPTIHNVQPTRTPGLLSISKPSQLSQRIKVSPKARQSSHSTQPVSVSSALPFSQGIVDGKAAETPEKRGRLTNKSKDSPRSSSQRRSHKARQPSPALNSSLSSQVEDRPIPDLKPKSKSDSTSKPTNVNVSDPFLDNFTHHHRQSPPKLTSQPSRKLARRRQRQGPDVPLLVIPPPMIPKGSNNKKAKRAHSPVAFPICDDSDEGLEDLSVPSTPTRTPAREYEDGPKTAPLGSSIPSFPFYSTPSPIKKTNYRRHKRTPSEGVFPAASDDEVVAPGRASGSNSDELEALFGLLARAQERAGTSQSDSEVERVRQAATAAIAGYFASSTFQNSPSPEELPPPTF